MPKKTQSLLKEIKLTDEQSAVISTTIKGCDCVLINAYAGAGKTFTLQMLAESQPNKHILYVCFNRETALQAKKRFPKNVDCKTIHSLAFLLSGGIYREKIGHLRSLDIMKWLDLSSSYLAVLAIQGVEKYLISSDEDIGCAHMPLEAEMCNLDLDELTGLSKRIWALMQDKSSPIPMTHDGYLKVWAKARPTLAAYDLILLDEAQDTNPVTLDVITRQRFHGSTGLVFVGDTHQSIYGFRGAVNAMDNLHEISTFNFALTKSFRFNSEIAGYASAILNKLKGDPVCIKGEGPSLSPAGDRVLIGRTNAEIIALSLQSCEIGNKVHFAGTDSRDNWDPYGPYDLQTPLDIFSLKMKCKNEIKSPYIRAFTSYEQLVEHARGIENGVGADPELANQISLVETLGSDLPDSIGKLRESSASPEDAAISFSTSHRSKGKEWKNVEILDDFIETNAISANEIASIKESAKLVEEINLIYVALTRARQNIKFNSDLSRWFSSI